MHIDFVPLGLNALIFCYSFSSMHREGERDNKEGDFLTRSERMTVSGIIDGSNLQLCVIFMTRFLRGIIRTFSD